MPYTRVGQLALRRRRRGTGGPAPRPTPASCTLVRPTRASLAQGAVEHRARFGLGLRRQHLRRPAPAPRRPARRWLRRSRRARSCRRPDPAWLSVMPASASARLLAQPAWPSTRSSHTGRSLTTASSSAAVGKRPSFQISWFQPRPRSQACPGLAPAYSPIDLQRAGQRGAVGQVELGQLLAQAEHVAVGVDQAGQHGAGPSCRCGAPAAPWPRHPRWRCRRR